VSNYCTAVSAVIPLLVLALMLEAGAPKVLAQRTWRSMVSRIKENPFAPFDERWEFQRHRITLIRTLWGAVAVEVITLVSIPFVPAGPPNNGWQVTLLLITSAFTLWIFGLVAWVLQGMVHELVQVEAAAKAADTETPTNREDERE
jgi:hypothetical protein